MEQSDRISICKTCEKRGFNFDSGLICSLSKSKPTFETDTCPDYVCDSKAFLEEYDKEEERKAEQKEVQSKTIMKLLASIVVGFICVGVFTFSLISESAFSLLSIVYLIGMILYCVLGIKAIIDFRKCKSNAILLIVSFYVILGILWVFNLLFSILERAPLSDYANYIKELVAVGVTIAFFFNSDDINELFPKESRTWAKTDKWLAGICVACLILPLILAFVVSLF